MIRSTDFHFDAPWGLALAVAIPLLLLALFSIERLKARPAQMKARPKSRPSGVSPCAASMMPENSVVPALMAVPAKAAFSAAKLP